MLPNELHIPLNKSNLARLLRLSLTSLVMGISLALFIRLDNPLFILITTISLSSVYLIFFVPLTILVLKKWKDRSAGISVDNTGITDNTSLFSSQHIPWGNIVEIKRDHPRYGKLLIIFIINPTEYINRQSNFIKRKIMKMTFKTYGSPIVIAFNELKYDFASLQNVLQTKLEENKLK